MTNGKLTIQPVQTPKERMEFIRFQWEVYRDDPLWVPPLVSERVHFLDEVHHPFYEHADVAFFMARRDDKPVGTLAVNVNYRHNEVHEEQVGFFGYFEVLKDREAAEALLETAGEWVKERGMTALRGPATFSLNEEAGLLVDGWDGPPTRPGRRRPRRRLPRPRRARSHRHRSRRCGIRRWGLPRHPGPRPVRFLPPRWHS